MQDDILHYEANTYIKYIYGELSFSKSYKFIYIYIYACATRSFLVPWYFKVILLQ